VWEDGTGIDEITETSPEVKEALNVISNDILSSKSAMLRECAVKAGLDVVDIKMSEVDDDSLAKMILNNLLIKKEPEDESN
jgi:hypothetical protein